MAFTEQKLYAVKFTLPDGEHLMTVRTSATGDKLNEHVTRILTVNPDAKFDLAKDMKEATEKDVEETAAAMKAKEPSRLFADELGLQTPNQILHDRTITNPDAPTE